MSGKELWEENGIREWRERRADETWTNVRLGGGAGWWFALALTTALSAVFSSYHQEIIAAISPYKDSIR